MEQVGQFSFTKRQGKKVVEIDNMAVVINEISSTEPSQGDNVVLTINIPLQLALEKALAKNIPKIKEKQIDFKEKNPLARLDVSPIIADCIRAMKESEQGKAQTGVGANALKLSESSATGLSTRTSRSSRKAG